MKLRVLLVSNQVRGIDGTGGLGDVAAALSKAIASNENIDIRILMPGYKTVSGKALDDRFDTIIAKDVPVPFGKDVRSADICQYRLPTVKSDEPFITCYLLCVNTFENATDSPEQAILLSRGTIEFLRTYESFRPDIIHCNDWHTGLIPVYLNTLYGNDPYLGRIATLYTTHNTGYFYQGAFPDDAFSASAETLLSLAGFGPWVFQPLQTRSLEHQGRLNFTKGGFGFADLINTVSITYSREIRTPAFGGGFEHLLTERSGNLCGIVNGIDTVEWDPANDSCIAPYNYSKSDPVDLIINQKRRIRNLLKKWRQNGHAPFSQIKDDTVIISFVGRLTDQKATILMPVWEKLCGLKNVQFVILGAAHPMDEHGKSYAAEIMRLTQSFKNCIFFFDGFSPELSHLIYSASDMFLMPSVYEPCGLAQMICMRYGTVPVVRLVGGLVDTVMDEQAEGKANGFGFKESVADSFAMADIPLASDLLYQTVKRALSVFRKRPNRWAELIKNGMTADFSWTVPARQYTKIYHASVRSRVNSGFLSK